jgi:hypothetical protein
MFELECKLQANNKEDIVAQLHEIGKLIKEYDREFSDNVDPKIDWELIEYEDGEVGQPGPKTYDVKVSVKQLVPEEELDFDDQQDGPSDGLEEEYEVKCFTTEFAEEAALDMFHEAYAIHTLDHFEITAVATERVGA